MSEFLENHKGAFIDSRNTTRIQLPATSYQLPATSYQLPATSKKIANRESKWDIGNLKIREGFYSKTSNLEAI
jgi:hypothetical protein